MKTAAPIKVTAVLFVREKIPPSKLQTGIKPQKKLQTQKIIEPIGVETSFSLGSAFFTGMRQSRLCNKLTLITSGTLTL